MTPVDAIKAFLRDDLCRNGHGCLYTAAQLAKAATDGGAPITDADVHDAIRRAGGITLKYRGGNSNVKITFDDPNRSATLQCIDTNVFSFNTEAAVQNGLAEWFRRNGWLVRQEVPDSDHVIQSIAERRTVDHLPPSSQSRSTQCRDLMAHAPQSPITTFHIVEVKGLTQLEADFYETFGQVFPIDDPAVTRGWTNNKVPKHGRCLKYATQFRTAWSIDDSKPLITLVVMVPDFPPIHFDPRSFHDGPTLYYPRQASMFSHFLGQRNLPDDHVFARLLRHLRDRYGLFDMVAGTSGLGFRFWGYQGLNWVRDFATNRAVDLRARAEL